MHCRPSITSTGLRIVLMAAVCLPVGLPMQAALGQGARGIPLASRAVDRLRLADGSDLYGIGVQSTPTQVTFAVRTAWLKEHEPDRYAQSVAALDAARQQVFSQAIERLQAWRKQLTEPPRLLAFVESEVDRIQKQQQAADDAAPALPEMLLLTVPAEQVKGSFSQPADRRQVFALALEHKLKNPESRSASSLTKELKELQVNIAEAKPDLAGYVSAEPQTDEQWAARQALIEASFAPGLHFQGTGGVVLPSDTAGENAALPLDDLLGGFLKQMLGGGLADGLGIGTEPANPTNQAFATATAGAEKANARGVRVSLLEQDAASGQVTVNSYFLARMPDGSWKTVWQESHTKNAADVTQEQVAVLQQDPRIAQAIASLKDLGLSPDASLLETAMRHGAATRLALDRANQAFVLFMQRHSQNVLSPPLWF